MWVLPPGAHGPAKKREQGLAGPWTEQGLQTGATPGPTVVALRSQEGCC